MNTHSHLFISYASEDRTFAEWLARKLASAGYAVWLDTLKMLGGEPWPQRIEDALHVKSGRMLALMSVNSVDKDNPRKERTAGLHIGKEREIDDFVIPLRLDEAKWNWTMGDLATVPFHQGWAAGWKQLLKKLDQIQFPRTLSDGAVLAQQSMETENLVLPEPETLRLNAIRADITQPVLRVYSLPHIGDEASKALKRNWACYTVGDKAIALAPPDKTLEGIKPTPAQQLWSEGGAMLRVPMSSIIPALVRTTMWNRLQRIGCAVHPKKSSVFYLPNGFNEKGRLPYSDLDGKQRTHQIRRYKTVRRGMEREKVFFHFAFRCDLAKGLDAGFYIQLVPTLMLFDADGNPIVDDRVNRLRKGITRGYYNAEWRDRFLAAEQLLLSTQATAADGITLAPEGISLSSPCRINEAIFEKEVLSPQEESADSEDAGELIDDEPLTPAYLDEE